jgi:hypothetical protein
MTSTRATCAGAHPRRARPRRPPTVGRWQTSSRVAVLAEAAAPWTGGLTDDLAAASSSTARGSWATALLVTFEQVDPLFAIDRPTRPTRARRRAGRPALHLPAPVTEPPVAIASRTPPSSSRSTTSATWRSRASSPASRWTRSAAARRRSTAQGLHYFPPRGCWPPVLRLVGQPTRRQVLAGSRATARLQDRPASGIQPLGAIDMTDVFSRTAAATTPGLVLEPACAAASWPTTSSTPSPTPAPRRQRRRARLAAQTVCSSSRGVARGSRGPGRKGGQQSILPPKALVTEAAADWRQEPVSASPP